MLTGPTGTAIALTFGMLADAAAKTAHGLLRSGSRFQILGLIDDRFSGKTPSDAVGAPLRQCPIFANAREALANLSPLPDYAVIGVAFPGGRLPESCIPQVAELLERGISLVSGLHQGLATHPVLQAAAQKGGAKIHDIRQPKAWNELHFWSGSVLSVSAPIVAVLGTDCALGKRTTARLAVDAFQARGVNAHMIYTGQTGWMQGNRYGFIFDATLNDFVSGELEHAIVQCDQNERPDLILIEGQSALRNPTGPCGAEMLLSGNAKGVILQAAPGRPFFKGTESLRCGLPPIESEIELIGRYGSEVLAVALNGEGTRPDEVELYRQELEARLQIPVVMPLQSIAPLVDALDSWWRNYKRASAPALSAA